MRAVVIERLDHPPRPGERPEPRGDAGLVEVAVAAASLNPIDISVGAGRFYGGHPPLPYIPGVEAAGTRLDTGRPVFVRGDGLGVSRDGTVAARLVAATDALIDLPDGVDPAVAAALGTAGLAGWLPITWRAAVQPGETVLVLGATGTAGGIAVQAARAAGAQRVVAAGRSRERLEGLRDRVDATVVLEEPGMQDRLVEACGDGADVIYDPLWGEPLVAALHAVKPGGRVVHLGQSAGPRAAIPSSLVRGRSLELLGFSVFALPHETMVSAYLTMVERWRDGKLAMDVIRVTPDDIEQAWTGTAGGTGKYAVVF